MRYNRTKTTREAAVSEVGLHLINVTALILLRPPTQAGQRRSLSTNCITANVVIRRVIHPGKKAAVVVATRQ